MKEKFMKNPWGIIAIIAAGLIAMKGEFDSQKQQGEFDELKNRVAMLEGETK